MVAASKVRSDEFSGMQRSTVAEGSLYENRQFMIRFKKDLEMRQTLLQESQDIYEAIWMGGRQVSEETNELIRDYNRKVQFIRECLLF